MWPSSLRKSFDKIAQSYLENTVNDLSLKNRTPAPSQALVAQKSGKLVTAKRLYVPSAEDMFHAENFGALSKSDQILHNAQSSGITLISHKAARAITHSFDDLTSAKLEMEKAIEGLSPDFSCFMGWAAVFSNYVVLVPSNDDREALSEQNEHILGHFGRRVNGTFRTIHHFSVHYTDNPLEAQSVKNELNSNLNLGPNFNFGPAKVDTRNAKIRS